MTIKEFFENYKFYYDIYVSLYDENNRSISGRDIWNDKKFDEFIEDHGDKEFKEWSVEDRTDYTQFHFYLKNV